MRREQSSGHTHAKLDSAEHFEIKPKANEPKQPMVNDAARRLQLSPSDWRWDIKPSACKWVIVQPGASIPGATSGERCWFCAERVDFSQKYLYSKPLSMVAHIECHAG